MPSDPNNSRKSTPIKRTIVEIGFILFLFYSNLLMGEFTRTNGQGKTLLFAVKDIFSPFNLGVGIVAGLTGYVVVEYLRKQT